MKKTSSFYINICAITAVFVIYNIFFLPYSIAQTKRPPVNQKIKSLNSSKENNLLNTGEKYYQNNQFEIALKYFFDALKITPSNDITLFNISKCYFAVLDLKNAYKYINKALSLAPKNTMYFTFKYEIKNCLDEEAHSNIKHGRIIENIPSEENVEDKYSNLEKAHYKVNPQNIIIELILNDTLDFDYEVYINPDGSISMPFKATAKILEIPTEQNHYNNAITFTSPSGIFGTVDYNSQQIIMGTKIIKFEPDSAKKMIFLKDGLTENIKDEVFVPVKYLGEILETNITTDLLNYSVSVKTSKPLTALLQYYTRSDNSADPFGNFDSPDDTYAKIIFPEKPPKFSLNTAQFDSDSQFYSDKFEDRNSVYKYLFRNNISRSELSGILFGGNYKLGLNSQVFGQDLFTFGGMNIKYKKPFGKTYLELGNLSGLRSKRILAAEDTIGAGISNIKEKPDSYNDVYGIAGLGSKVNVYLNDKLTTTINTRGGYYNLSDISYQNDKITKLRLEEITFDGSANTIKEEQYPLSDGLLIKGKTEYSIFSGITGYQNQIFSNYYYSTDMNSKKLAGGIKLSHGLTDKMTVSLISIADHLVIKPAETDFSSLFPFDNNTSSLLYSAYKDFNYISGQTLLSSLDYSLTKNILFSTDLGLSHSKNHDSSDNYRDYKFKSTGFAVNSALNYEKENYALSGTVYNYSPSFYMAGSSGIGSSASALNDKIGGEVGGRIGTRFASISGNVGKYSTNLDNYFMDGNFNFDNYNYTVRVPLPGDSDINFRQSSRIGKNTLGELANKSYEISMRKKLSRNLDFDLNGQLLKFDSEYLNDNYESDMKYLSAKVRYDVSESLGEIELSHDTFKTKVNQNELGYNALRINYTPAEFKNIITSVGTGFHYTGIDKGFDFSASLGYKFHSGRRLMLTYNFNRQLGSVFDDIFIPRSTRHSIDVNLSDAFMVNSGIKSIGYAREDTGYIQTIAFLDSNQNGIKDNNEPNIPEIGVNLANNKNLTYYTNKKGVYTSGGIQEGLYKVSLNYDELPSVLAVSPASSEEVLVRVDKNKSSKVYFGLLSMIGSVSGKILVTDEFDRKINLKNLILVLYNEKGEEVKYTTIGEDGNYYISGISPGKYTVNLDKDFLREYHLKPKTQDKKEIEVPLSYKDNIEFKDINLDYLQTFENSL
jgi:hypothetical protein